MPVNVNKEILNVSTENMQLISVDQAWFYSIVPKSQYANKISFYIDESRNIESTRDELEILLGKEIELEATPHDLITQTISKLYRKKSRNG